MKNINEKLGNRLSDSFKSDFSENSRRNILILSNLWYSLRDPLVGFLEAVLVDNVKQKEVVNEDYK